MISDAIAGHDRVAVVETLPFFFFLFPLFFFLPPPLRGS